VLLDGVEVGVIQTVNTGDWINFTESTPIGLGAVAPGIHTVAVRLGQTDPHGIDLDRLRLWSGY
jgi:hypothetical protein